MAHTKDEIELGTFRVDPASATDRMDCAKHICLIRDIPLPDAFPILVRHLERGLEDTLKAFFQTYGQWPTADLIEMIIADGEKADMDAIANGSN